MPKFSFWVGGLCPLDNHAIAVGVYNLYKPILLLSNTMDISAAASGSAPTYSGTLTGSVDENSAVGATVTLDYTFTDPETDAMTFTLSGKLPEFQRQTSYYNLILSYLIVFDTARPVNWTVSVLLGTNINNM